jgi:DNA-binding transcriptional MerR regulator
MVSTEIYKRGLLRISEVAEITGVSLPTIHFYAREGLISPAVKTARNMAYYSAQCVNDIRLIKELQSKRFLPLSVIKMIIQHRQQGQDINHVIEMQTFLDDIFHPVAAGGPQNLTFKELLRASQLSAEELNALESIGLLMPEETARGKLYDDIDLRIAQIARELMQYGITPADLSIYGQYVEVTRNEARAMHARIHEHNAADSAPVATIQNTIRNLKECLATKVLRQTISELHKEAP